MWFCKDGQVVREQGPLLNKENSPISPCKFVYDFDAAVAFKAELEKEIPGISEKLSVIELDKLIDFVHDQTLLEVVAEGYAVQRPGHQPYQGKE